MKLYLWRRSIFLQILLLVSLAFSGVQPAFAQVANDKFVNLQKHLKQVKADQAWNMVTGNTTIKIALLDSGVDRSHPDLNDNLLPVINYVSSESSDDLNGHGTKVAGILAAEGNNRIGVSGVMWKARILPIKVLNKDGRQDDVKLLARAIRRAVDEGSKVILMSMTYNYSSPELENAITYAENHGVVVVAASGNEGGRVDYPAAYPTVIAVGAVDSTNKRLAKSNYGPELDLVAPGSYIYSTAPHGKYGDMTGTSAAAPQVAGAAALILAMYPKLTPLEVREVLYDNATDLGQAGWDKFHGHGLLDVYRSVKSKLPSDTNEWNNTQARAVAFPIESQKRAQLSKGDTVDWYFTDLEYDGKMVFSVTANSKASSPLAVTYYVRDHPPVTYYLGNGSTLTVPGKRGRVYMKVERVGSEIGTINYKLLQRFYINADRYEPNNSKEIARPLPIGNHSRINGNFHSQEDDDWYSYKFSENGKLNLVVGVDTLRIDPHILITKQGYQGSWEYDNGLSKSPTERVVDFPITPGKYYFRVKNYDEQAVNGEYYFDFTYTPERKDVNEPNDSYLSATRLGNSTLMTGTLASKYDYDWYSFQVTTDSYVTIRAPYVPMNYGVNLSVYKHGSFSSPLFTERSVAQLSNQNRSIMGKRLSPGTYYVRLNSSVSSKYETYRLTVTKEPLVFGYRDISTHWAKNEIIRLSKNGIAKGFRDYSFRPDAGVTRAQFAEMIIRSMKASGVYSGTTIRSNPFKDLKRNHWAYDSVLQAYQLGIIQGYANKTIQPDKTLTRAEMAAMLARAKKLPLYKRSYTSYRDVNTKYWAAPAIEILRVLEWMEGYPNGLFKPTAYVKRAEMIVLLAKAYRL